MGASQIKAFAPKNKRYCRLISGQQQQLVSGFNTRLYRRGISLFLLIISPPPPRNLRLGRTYLATICMFVYLVLCVVIVVEVVCIPAASVYLVLCSLNWVTPPHLPAICV